MAVSALWVINSQAPRVYPEDEGVFNPIMHETAMLYLQYIMQYPMASGLNVHNGLCLKFKTHSVRIQNIFQCFYIATP